MTLVPYTALKRGTARRSPAPFYGTLATAVAIAAIIVVSVVYDQNAKDTFRTPKELAFRGFGILAATLLGFYFSRRGALRDFTRTQGKSVLIVPLAVIVWTAVTTATSTARLLSLDSLVTVVSSVALFYAVLLAASHDRFFVPLIDASILVAAVNAGLTISQEYGYWQPFGFPLEFSGHQSTTALIGSPNDVGTFLLIPALAAVVVGIVSIGVRRAAYFLAAAILVAGLIASGTRGALVPFAAGTFILWLRFRHRTVAVMLVASGIIVIVFAFVRFGRDFKYMWTAGQTQHYDILFSERLPAFLTAIDMTRDHPLTGVGPGAYKIRYMRYRLELVRRYPPSWLHGAPLNFAETHNDHLQICAETGLSGYLLLITSFIVVMRGSFSLDDADDGSVRTRFKRLFSIVVVAAVFFVMIFQFPLQLAAPRLMILYFAGLTSASSAKCESQP